MSEESALIIINENEYDRKALNRDKALNRNRFVRACYIYNRHVDVKSIRKAFFSSCKSSLLRQVF